MGAQPHAADLEVFLEAVGLKEVGEFEGADVAALRADFPLQIEDDGAQIWQGVAQAQQFIPHPFPVEGQTQALTGQLTIELVGLADGGGRNGKGSWRSRLGHKPGFRLWWERWSKGAIRRRRAPARWPLAHGEAG